MRTDDIPQDPTPRDPENKDLTPKDLRRFKMMETRLAKFEQEMAASLKEKSTLAEQLAAANEKAQRLDKAVETVRDQELGLKKLQEQGDLIQKERDAARAETAALRTNLKTLTDQFAALTNQFASLPLERDALQKERDILRDELKNAKDKLAAQPPAMATDILVGQNRELAEQLKNVSRDVDLLHTTTEEARKAASVAGEAVKNAEQARQKSEGALKAATEELERTRGQINILMQQVKDQGKSPALPPEQVADLVGRFVSHLGGSLPNLRAQGGELHLKVAFGGTPTAPAFVLPSADTKPETLGALHDLTLRFGEIPDIG